MDKNNGRYIYRVDNKYNHNYAVRIKKDGGHVTQKTFSDSAYGGKEQALIAALRFRDHEAERVGVALLTGNQRNPQSINARNTSGVIGVCLNTENKKGIIKPFWVANYRVGPDDCRKTQRVSFSIDAHGYETAFHLAVKARYKGIGKPVPRGLRPP